MQDELGSPLLPALLIAFAGFFQRATLALRQAAFPLPVDLRQDLVNLLAQIPGVCFRIVHPQLRPQAKDRIDQPSRHQPAQVPAALIVEEPKRRARQMHTWATLSV